MSRIRPRPLDPFLTADVLVREVPDDEDDDTEDGDEEEEEEDDVDEEGRQRLLGVNSEYADPLPSAG